MNNSIEWKEDQEGWQLYKKAKVLQHQSTVGGLWNLVNQPAAKAIQHVAYCEHPHLFIHSNFFKKI